MDTKLVFTVLGPVLLALGVLRWLGTGRMVPQAKTWLLIGAIFSAVAAWLWFGVA
jgi:hypothetical protein